MTVRQSDRSGSHSPSRSGVLADEPQEARPRARPTRLAGWLVGGCVAALLALAASLVVGRKLAEGPIPRPPRDASELGPVPASDEAWAPLRDEVVLVRALDVVALTELSYQLPRRSEVVAVMERHPAAAFRALDESIDRWFASPLADGCRDPEACAHLLFEGSNAVEVMALWRWARGDVTRASSLLEAFLRSTAVTARTARSSAVQGAALSSLAEIVRVVRALDEHDRDEAAEQRLLTPTLADFVAELAHLDVDLGRPWIGQMQAIGPELSSFLASAQPRTRFFVDGPAVATDLYASYESCIRAARSGAPIDASMSAYIPAADPDDWRVAEDDTFGLASLESECGALLELARADLERIHTDASELRDQEVP